jgi:dolichyl-phosphate beta-glucosyltransferase
MNNHSDKTQQVEEWIKRQSPSDIPVDISIVVPAYNEQWRLPTTLIDMIDYFDSRGSTYEIIVVDDGSTDATVEGVRKFEKIRPNVRLIRVPTNHGKGYAVKTGVLNAKGRRVLFADADGATPIAEVERLHTQLDAGADVAFGSRAAASSQTKVVTRWYRKYIGRVFNLIVNTLVLPGIADTQCGFKMFSAPAAKFLFEQQRAERFSFDVEILLLARKAGLQIAEVPVNWTNVPGSKVNLVVDSLKMFRDMFIFKVRHRAVSPESFANYCEQ